MFTKTVLSGIRATGDLQLGNYLGAIKRWVEEPKKSDERNIFMIADLHALTTHQGMDFKTQNRKVAATYIAAGLDPAECIIFCQSEVSGHTELAWYLSCHVPLGWLNRMTQFKDKAKKKPDAASLGLYAYPVLMASDILLYDTTHVPVGEDQKQHVELARDIALSINNQYGCEIFTLPEPVIGKEGARIMSLRDGTQKMGKSDESDYSRINLIDSDDLIEKKIKKAKTDAFPIPDNVKDLDERCEAKNLLTIMAILQNKTLQDVCEEFAGKNFSEFKPKLSDVVVSSIAPIGMRIKELLDEEIELDNILNAGRDKARAIAEKNIKKFYNAFGF